MLYMELKDLGNQWKEFAQHLQFVLKKHGFKSNSKYNNKIIHDCDIILKKKTDFGQIIIGSKFKMKIHKFEIRIQVSQVGNDLLFNIIQQDMRKILPNELISLVKASVEEARKKIAPEGEKPIIVQLDLNEIRETSTNNISVFECKKCHAPLPMPDNKNKIQFCPYCDSSLYMNI